MSTKAKAAWIEEHLFYEYSMLRDALASAQNAANAGDQLQFNMCFESFLVHARNLEVFLKNQGKQGSYKARDFAPAYRLDNTAKAKHKADTAFQDINHQAFHMGDRRPHTLSEGKTSLQKGKEVAAWIELEFGRFVALLPTPFADAWAAKIGTASLSAKPLTVSVGSPLSATNHITIVSTGTAKTT
jgi:hypothetical protein